MQWRFIHGPASPLSSGSLIDSPKPELGERAGRSAQQSSTKNQVPSGHPKINKKAPKTTPCATL
jgi:hypothetical protein